MTMRELAERVGVSASYMSEVSRGRRGMGVRVQALVEAALEAEAQVAPAQPASIDREAVWGRMDAHGVSQNEVARRAGISSAHLSQIMCGKTSPLPGVLKRLHGVLFQRTKAERVMPAEVKVLGWRKGERHGMVVRGAGGPGRSSRVGGGAVRVGGLGRRWEAALAALDVEMDAGDADDTAVDNGTVRVRKAPVRSIRRPTPLQTARWNGVQKAKRRGLSIRGVARELGIHRATAKKYMEAVSPPIKRDRVG